jgi:myosin-5
MKTYMLERPRVTALSAGERNYHIFYQLLAGLPAEKASALGLHRGVSSFRVLNRSGCIDIAHVDDNTEYQATMESLHAVGATPHDVDTLIQALAAVLHIGNIEFKSNGDASAVQGSEECSGLSEAALCMQVTAEDLAAALTTTYTVFVGEEVIKPNTVEQSAAIRDATARLVYARLFDWVAGKISECFGNSTADGTHDAEHHTSSHDRDAYVGVLDLFGFEFFEHNSFEQLCINFANEKLQQLFINHVLASVQTEYKEEGVPTETVAFVDNAAVISLISRRGGVLSALDEELRLPNGSDESFGNKLIASLSDDTAFEKPRFGSDSFTICHFAGNVTYEVAGFLKKNTDSTPEGITRVLASSKHPFFQSLSLAPSEDTAQTGAPTHDKKTGGRARLTTLGTQSKRVATVGTKFSDQLGNLVMLLETTELHYVRCIKPNAQKRPRVLERTMACDQLRSAGLMSAVQISRVGFPSRLPHAVLLTNCAVLLRALSAATDSDAAGAEKRAVLRRYLEAVPSGEPSAAEACAALLSLTIGGAESGQMSQEQQPSYAVGKTQVFLRAGLLSELSAQCNYQLGSVAITIQRYARGWLCRVARRRAQDLEQKRRAGAATLIQAYARGRIARVGWVARCAAESIRIEAEANAKRDKDAQAKALEEAECRAAIEAAAGDAAAELDTLKEQLASEKKLRLQAESELASTRVENAKAQKSLEVKNAALKASEMVVAELRKQLAAVTQSRDAAGSDQSDSLIRPLTPANGAVNTQAAGAGTASVHTTATRRAALEARLRKVQSKHTIPQDSSEPTGPPPDRPGWKACWASSKRAWYWWEETTLVTTWIDPASMSFVDPAECVASSASVGNNGNSRTTPLLVTPSKAKAKRGGKAPPTRRPRPRR